jgi:hypothetical protein
VKNTPNVNYEFVVTVITEKADRVGIISGRSAVVLKMVLWQTLCVAREHFIIMQ